jgi:hypothetical protein
MLSTSKTTVSNNWEGSLFPRTLSSLTSLGRHLTKRYILLAPDRNVRVLSPIEMSVYRREAVCREELCVCKESESSRRDELLSVHTARCGGWVQTSCLPTTRNSDNIASLDERITLLPPVENCSGFARHSGPRSGPSVPAHRERTGLRGLNYFSRFSLKRRLSRGECQSSLKRA